MSWAASAQTETGELRISVFDPSGNPLPAAAQLTSQVNHYRREFEADAKGRIFAKRLPFGFYALEVRYQGFAPLSTVVEIRSALPVERSFTLAVAAVETSLTVNDSATLLDPHRVGVQYHIGSNLLQDRLSGRPGRSLAELVSMEPGWVFEANGILHPRGSEYQTQYVVDGIPLVENRSSAFVPDLDVNNVQEMDVMTASFPAEYGRKLGGVIEVQTVRDTRKGFHGKAVASGGSFDTAHGYLEGLYGWGANTLTFSGALAGTSRYLDPPVLENYSNRGTNVDATGHYERDLDSRNRLGVVFRREQARFLVPNELLQQQAGQRQDRSSDETALQFLYQHIFSSNVIGSLRAMGRDVTASLWSNPFSTPIIAGQDRSYREGYVKGDVSVHTGLQEFKFGAEGDFASIREALSYVITDPGQFDPDTPATFHFMGRAQDREQSAFVQDLIRLGNWTFSAGLRLDHYRLLVDKTAWSPRTGLAYYWPALDTVFHFSYDRIFQTPAFENLLVSSSPEVESLSGLVLRLPVQPSRGNFYEAGLSKAVFGKLRVDGNLFHRDFTNYADDDLLLNTGISFPIAFSKAVVYGAEVKLDVLQWGPVSGFISYSNLRGNGYFPVTGGLFLGDNAASALNPNANVFPITQDQRNTARARVLYQIGPRLWAAMGGSYNSGLPAEFTGTPQDAVAHFGRAIVDRVNFSNQRVRPGFTIDASVGAILSKRDRETVRFQIDALNLTDQLNVINFAGLFSGTAIAPSRSVNARLQLDF